MQLLWVRFSDMHSGGGRKTEHDAYLIQAPSMELAVLAFEEYTGCDAYHTTCDCCGPDWAIYETDGDDVGRDTLVIDWATITDALDA